MSLIPKAFGVFCAITWAFFIAGVLLTVFVGPDALVIVIGAGIWVILSTPAFLVLRHEDSLDGRD